MHLVSIDRFYSMIDFFVYFIFVSLLLVILRKHSVYFFAIKGLAIFLSLPAMIVRKEFILSEGVLNFGFYSVSIDSYYYAFAYRLLSFLCMALFLKLGMRTKIQNVYNIPLYASENFIAITAVSISVFLIFYMHVHFSFEHVLNPRKLYESSRGIFDFLYFVSGILIRLSLIFFLISKRSALKKFIFTIFTIIVSMLLGAKINAFVLALISLIYYIVYVKRFSVKIRWVITIFFACLCLGGLLLRITFWDADGALILRLFSAYLSEPWLNFVLLMDSFELHFADYFYGQILWETYITTFMPRSIFPEKPLLFSTFLIANEYYPEIVSLGLGAPSFGYEGLLYADFGVFGLVLLLFSQCFSMLILGMCIKSALINLVSTERISWFTLFFVMTLSGASVATLPPAHPVFVNVGLFILIVIILSRWKIRIFAYK